MQNILKKLTKNWITIWLVIAAISFTSIVVYATYTRVTVAKRVISTGAGAGDMFSSDILLSTITQIKRVSYSDDQATPNVSLNFYNYPYPKKSACGADDTLYNVTTTLGKLSDTNQFVELTASEIADLSKKYEIVNNEKENDSFVFGTDGLVSRTFIGCSIEGGDFNANTFTLKFDPAELKDSDPKGYCMQIIAKPDDLELPTLRGIVLVRYNKAADTGWNGKVEDLNADTNYDGFNYVIKGDGKGKITFSWDSTAVTINQQFLHNPNVKFYVNDTEVQGSDSFDEESSIITTNGDIKTLTLVVDSRTRNRYDVQFYKIDPAIDYSVTNVKKYLPESHKWVPDGTASAP